MRQDGLYGRLIQQGRCDRFGVMSRNPFAVNALFAWYDRHGRELPWRSRWPELSPAYHVWLSEIMLQQTVVNTVIPYFLDFIRRWPRIEDLAAATQDEVMSAWAGLGYYARARNLHNAAIAVSREHGGVFPQSHAALLALPGVGPYTAGAISAIAFGHSEVVVDGNIERVLSRFFAIRTPLPAAKQEISRHYAQIMPGERPSDFPQALMDFANAVCTPKNPGCTACPLAANCKALAEGAMTDYPVKAKKKSKPTRKGIAYVARNKAGDAFLVRRPPRGLLGGLLAFPSSGWDLGADADVAEGAARPSDTAPFTANWRLLDEKVHHVFTHFSLELEVAVVELEDAQHLGGGQWQRVRPDDLPSLMRKVWNAVKASDHRLL